MVKQYVSVSKKYMCMLVPVGEGCVSPVAAEFQSAPAVEWSSEENCCSLAGAAVGGETIERMRASSLAGWESVRIEGVKREWQKQEYKYYTKR